MFVFIFYRYSNTACELLTSDVSQINDALADSEELVKKLYAFLEMEKPLNPLLASFFSKVMGLLITRKSEMVRISNKMKYVIFYKKNNTFTIQLNTQKVLHLIGSGVDWKPLGSKDESSDENRDAQQCFEKWIIFAICLLLV